MRKATIQMEDRQKLKRLADVAEAYYHQNKKQSEIAKELGVSRPFVSRLLAEARELGVVEIVIHNPEEQMEELLGRLGEGTSLTGGILVRDGDSDSRTNRMLAQAAAELIGQLGTKRLGIGFGHFIGEMAEMFEQNGPVDSPVRTVCPLIGNAPFLLRNYQSNENVRIFAEGLKAEPYFMHLPALSESIEEKQLLCSTGLYRQAQNEWSMTDTLLINVGNYPSTPDLASVARYGDMLHRERACGRLLSYFYNEDGRIIQSDRDFAIQIPLDELMRVPNRIAVCSANTGVRTLRGALRTGVLTHLVADESLAQAVLEEVRPQTN